MGSWNATSDVSVFNSVTNKLVLFALIARAVGQGAAVHGFKRLSRAVDAVTAELSIRCAFVWPIKQRPAWVAWMKMHGCALEAT